MIDETSRKIFDEGATSGRRWVESIIPQTPYFVANVTSANNQTPVVLALMGGTTITEPTPSLAIPINSGTNLAGHWNIEKLQEEILRDPQGLMAYLNLLRLGDYGFFRANGFDILNTHKLEDMFNIHETTEEERATGQFIDIKFENAFEYYGDTGPNRQLVLLTPNNEALKQRLGSMTPIKKAEKFAMELLSNYGLSISPLKFEDLLQEAQELIEAVE